jgi:hypothetical protein
MSMHALETRYGSPDDLLDLVEEAHKKHISVILEWPATFVHPGSTYAASTRNADGADAGSSHTRPTAGTASSQYVAYTETLAVDELAAESGGGTGSAAVGAAGGAAGAAGGEGGAGGASTEEAVLVSKISAQNNRMGLAPDWQSPQVVQHFVDSLDVWLGDFGADGILFRDSNQCLEVFEPSGGDSGGDSGGGGDKGQYVPYEGGQTFVEQVLYRCKEKYLNKLLLCDEMHSLSVPLSSEIGVKAFHAGTVGSYLSLSLSVCLTQLTLSTQTGIRGFMTWC